MLSAAALLAAGTGLAWSIQPLAGSEAPSEQGPAPGADRAPLPEAAPGAATTAAATEAPPEGEEGDAAPEGPGGAFTAGDDAHREALAHAPIARVVKGSGGRSLGFRITVEDGTTGYYKPEQTFSGTHWHAEVASYYLDRDLGLGRVPPTVGRRLDWAPLRRAAGADDRVDEVLVQDDGTVRGAFVWWIPEDIPPIRPGAYWERWIRVTGPIDVSPLVAGYAWREALREGTAPHPGTKKAPDTPDRPAELSDMVLFDYLTHNLDRWGSHFTNVRTRGRGGPLIFLDNAAGFFPGRHRIGIMDARLSVVQKFRRRTIEAIRGLDVDAFRERLAADPLAPVLNDHWLEGLAVRRDHLLEHVAAMEQRFGDAVYSW